MTDGVLVLHTFCLKGDGSSEKSGGAVRARQSVAGKGRTQLVPELQAPPGPKLIMGWEKEETSIYHP